MKTCCKKHSDKCGQAGRGYPYYCCKKCPDRIVVKERTRRIADGKKAENKLIKNINMVPVGFSLLGKRNRIIKTNLGIKIDKSSRKDRYYGPGTKTAAKMLNKAIEKGGIVLEDDIKKGLCYRRLYPYICKKCQKSRETVRYPRLVAKICRKCQKDIPVPGQTTIFDKLKNIFKK